MDHQKRKVVITGGAGYVGWCLIKQLVKNGYRNIVVFDKNFSQSFDYDCPVIKLQGDITNFEAVKSAFKNAMVVFHLASYGMMGYESLATEKIMSVNVGGTDNVIQACISCSVRYLIYTSSVNVVFGGQEIINGDETMPYFPLDKHVDEYSKSKTIADQMVLSSNGATLAAYHFKDGEQYLKTCVLRFAGVYGAEEQKMLPKVTEKVVAGKQ